MSLTPSSEATKHSESGEQVDLHSLIREFYEDSGELAEFELVANVPPPFDGLLDHHAHMTVTVESFHGQAVDVVVHRSCSVLQDGAEVIRHSVDTSADDRIAIAEQTNSYNREITLVTHESKQTVQYGIVRLNPAFLDANVWREIASGEIPLGRVLITHNVLRQVQLCRLWRVTAGKGLSHILECSEGEVVYGRTALIRCDQKPAIELLEIVRVEPNSSQSQS